MVAERLEIVPSSISSNRSYEFFKVYLPKFSSHQLVIPPAFISSFGGSLPGRKATLTDQTGKLWRVWMENNAKLGVFLTKGWHDFANYHSLEFGDFLVFSYDGTSNFSVSIFGRNGCKKDFGGPANRFSIPVKQEWETVPSKPEPDSGYDKVARNVKKTKGSIRADRCEIKWVPGRKCGEEPSQSKEPLYVKPKNPHFVRRITPSNRYIMTIPMSILRLYGIKLESDVELRDQDGKKWPVKVTFAKKKRIYMATGWDRFRRSHGLKNNNKCLFEFILGRRKICSEIHVQIIRGYLKTETKNRCQVIGQGL